MKHFYRRNIRWLLLSMLLSFTAAQLVHAHHSVDSALPESQHLACYICQSHSASAVNSHELVPAYSTFTTVPFLFSIQLNTLPGFPEYQRLLRAPPVYS